MLISQCKSCIHSTNNNKQRCKKYLITKPKHVLECNKECFKFKHINLLNIKTKTKLEEQILGATIGFCVADALGVPVEFSSRPERDKDPVNEMRAYGAYHHQKFGTWSDDSSMMLCLMDSLKNGYDLKDLANNFCKFLYEGYWTPENKVFDIGNTTIKAIERMKLGTDPIKCGFDSDNDNGNGSLMRVLPLAFYLKDTTNQEKLNKIEQVSSLTHSHKRSILACIIYIEFAINLIKGLSKEDAYKETVQFINTNCKDKFNNELKHFDKILDISLLDPTQIKSSGYVIDSLEASLWAFMTSNNYKETILKAINLGGDTDTIAAICGGLAGIYFGLQTIPDNWIQCLARKEDILKLSLEFYNALNNL